MNRVLRFVETIARDIGERTARLGDRVTLDANVLDRSDSLALQAPGVWSANGFCRLIETKDGWIAANLPRADDVQALPALLEHEVDGDAWATLSARARESASADLLSRAEMLGLAFAAIGETQAPPAPCAVRAHQAQPRGARLRLVDFSSLWAGPLCGGVFAAMGADVVKLESQARPDPTPQSAPALDQLLNGRKIRRTLALTTQQGRDALLDEIAQADVLITSARARALTEFNAVRRPGSIWIAITGHGFNSARVAFGDDAAASGGLVRWENNEPRFIGDALADPLTGLAAANAALALLEQGRGGFIDASLAHAAAYVAGLRP
jgi:hypothetical protein